MTPPLAPAGAFAHWFAQRDTLTFSAAGLPPPAPPERWQLTLMRTGEAQLACWANDPATTALTAQATVYARWEARQATADGARLQLQVTEVEGYGAWLARTLRQDPGQSVGVAVTSTGGLTFEGLAPTATPVRLIDPAHYPEAVLGRWLGTHTLAEGGHAVVYAHRYTLRPDGRARYQAYWRGAAEPPEVLRDYHERWGTYRFIAPEVLVVTLAAGGRPHTVFVCPVFTATPTVRLEAAAASLSQGTLRFERDDRQEAPEDGVGLAPAAQRPPASPVPVNHPIPPGPEAFPQLLIGRWWTYSFGFKSDYVFYERFTFEAGGAALYETWREVDALGADEKLDLHQEPGVYHFVGPAEVRFEPANPAAAAVHIEVHPNPHPVGDVHLRLPRATLPFPLRFDRARAG